MQVKQLRVKPEQEQTQEQAQAALHFQELPDQPTLLHRISTQESFRGGI